MFALSLASIVLFPSVINRFDVVAVLVLAVVACHTKPPMALFGFSAALLGLLRYSAKRYQTTLALLTIASALGATLVSISFNSGGGSTPDGQSVVSVSQQLAFALRNPVATFQSLDSALWSALSIEQLAHPLGWLDTHLHKRALSSWYTILWIALAFEVLGLLNLPWRSLSSRATGRSLGVSLLYLLGIYVASLATPFILYLSWTAVGAPGVEGMQSRYLFTSLLLVPAALTPFYGYEQPKTDAPEKVSHRIELGAVVVAMALLTALYVSELHITTAARYW
jgi:uncharacterized membrane protein